jgi:hypothetical protein
MNSTNSQNELLRGNRRHRPFRSLGGFADNESSEEGCMTAISVEDLRAIAENPNFNLTSVLQNPRASVSKSLYEEIMDFDLFSLTFDSMQPFKV